MITDMLERLDEYLEEHPALENRLEHGTLMAAACIPVYAYAGYATLDSFGLPKRFGRIGAWSVGLSILSGALWSCLPQAKEKAGANVEKEVIRQYSKYKGSVMEEMSLSLQEYQVNKIYENRMEDIERETDIRLEGFKTLGNGQRVPVFHRTRPGDYDWHPGHAKVDPRLMQDYVRNAADWHNWEDGYDDEFSVDLEWVDDLDFDVDYEPDILPRGYQPPRGNNGGNYNQDRYYYDRDGGTETSLTKLWAERGFGNKMKDGGSRSVVTELMEGRQRKSGRMDSGMEAVLKYTESGRKAAAELEARGLRERKSDDDMKFGKPRETEAEPERVAPKSARGMLQRQFAKMQEDVAARQAATKQTTGGTLIKGTVDVRNDPRTTSDPTHRVNTPAESRNISPSIAGEADPDFNPDVPKPTQVYSLEELMMDDDDDGPYPLAKDRGSTPPLLSEGDNPFNNIPVIRGAVHARGPVSDEDPH